GSMDVSMVRAPLGECCRRICEECRVRGSQADKVQPMYASTQTSLLAPGPDQQIARRIVTLGPDEFPELALDLSPRGLSFMYAIAAASESNRRRVDTSWMTTFSQPASSYASRITLGPARRNLPNGL